MTPAQFCSCHAAEEEVTLTHTVCGGFCLGASLQLEPTKTVTGRLNPRRFDVPHAIRTVHSSFLNSALTRYISIFLFQKGFSPTNLKAKVVPPPMHATVFWVVSLTHRYVLSYVRGSGQGTLSLICSSDELGNVARELFLVAFFSFLA